MLTRGIASALIAYICLGRSLAYIEWIDPTANCTNAPPVYGRGSLCGCTDQCIDGTIVNQPGLCRYYGQLCKDMSNAPSCAGPNQARLFDYTDYEDGGTCFDNGADTCPWGRPRYHWRCCDCPAGYTTASFKCGTGAGSLCVGCNGQGETLRINTTGGFECVAKPCTLTADGEKLIKSYEKFRPRIYDAGDGDQTIGWGHDCTRNGDCDKYKGKTITLKQGNAIFDADVAVRIKSLQKKIPNMGGLNANQFDALVSFYFNCPGHVGLFVPYFKAKNYSGFCNALPNTCTEGYSGLPARRKAESTLCNTPTDEMSGC